MKEWSKSLAHFCRIQGVLPRGYLRFMQGCSEHYSQTEGFEKISSPHIIRICLGVLRTLGLYIKFHQSAINDHPCCLLAHASPLSVLQHALRRKCSLMATPPKRDSVNDQSSFKFRSVDSQTISF